LINLVLFPSVGGSKEKSGSGNKNANQKALPRAKEQIKILEETVRKQSEQLEKQRKRIRQVENENERLKKELAAARQPPKWAKPNKSKKEKKKGKKLGPKKGHKPNKRKIPEQADEQVRWFPLICPESKTELPEPHKWHSHYQIELPCVTAPIITEHLVGWSWCVDCGKEVSVSHKLGSSLYGPRLHATVAYWKFTLGLTLGKIHKLLLDQYKLDISTGVLSQILTRAAKKFESSYDDLKTQLSDESHLHVDETGWRCMGNNHWLWSFSSDNISVYEINKSRSQGVVEEVLGKSYSGILVTDFYGAYHKIESQKQKCWTHLLRDLHETKKQYPRSQEIRDFAKKAKRFFERGKKLQADYEAGKNIDSRLKRLVSETHNWMFTKYRHKELKRLRKRLIKHRNELYTFIKTGVEPTNNNGEREIRPTVLMRKTSYCNRSAQGRENQQILMTIGRTATKRKQNFVELATEHLKGNRPPNYWMGEVSPLNRHGPSPPIQ
jgi:predicted nuclease with TOPRIM domain